MRYKIGTIITFKGDEGVLWEKYQIKAYAITKDARVVYLIDSSFNEYDDQYAFLSEEELAKEIKEREDDYGEIAEIEEAE